MSNDAEENGKHARNFIWTKKTGISPSSGVETEAQMDKIIEMLQTWRSNKQQALEML